MPSHRASLALAALLLSASAGLALAQGASPALAYCGAAPAGGQVSLICANPKLVEIEKRQAATFAAVIKHFEGRPKIVEALLADEARFLRQRDATLRNKEKLSAGDPDRGERNYDPAHLMTVRIGFLNAIDTRPRETLEGWWGGAEGFAGIWRREGDPLDITLSIYGDRALKAIGAGRPWLCWGMGSPARGKFTLKGSTLEVRVVKGDGEDLKSQDVRVERRDGMLYASGLPLKPVNRKGDGVPFCPPGASLQAHVPMFPLKAQPPL